MFVEECFEDPKFVDSVITLCKVGCLASLAFLIVQLVFGPSFNFYGDLNPNVTVESATRYPSYFHDSQKYGQYLAMSSFLFLIPSDNRNATWANFVGFLMPILGILLTGSRAPFLGFGVGFCLIVLTERNGWWYVGLFSVIAFLLADNLSSLPLFTRGDDMNSAYEVRRAIWKEGWEIFLANPILGIGIENHHNYVEAHSASGFFVLNDEIVYYGAENGYLKILIELGVFGFAIVMALIGIPVIGSLRFLTQQNSARYIVASIFSWSVAVISVPSLDDKRILIMLGTLISILIFYEKMRQRDAQPA
jgi:O-antigen ligase